MTARPTRRTAAASALVALPLHLLGPAGQGCRYDVYAAPDDDRLLQLGFRTELPRPKRERLVASVLATVRLR